MARVDRLNKAALCSRPARKSVRRPDGKSHQPGRAARLVIVGVLLSLVLTGAVLHQRSADRSEQVLSQTAGPPTQLRSDLLVQVEACLFPIGQFHGYQLRIASGFRSFADQDALYAQGRTAPGDIVTNARGGRSLHNYGLAIDVVDQIRGYDIDWQRLGRIGQYCGLEHGDRGHQDLPHFQHRGGLELDQIASGHMPSQLSLPCELLAKRYHEHQPLIRQDLQQCKVPPF